MTRSLLLTLLSLSLAATACGGAPNDDDALDAEEELRTGGVTSIHVTRSAGFRPPPPPGECEPSAEFTVSFEDKRLTTDACIDHQVVDVSRELTANEFKKVKTALSKVRTTRKPRACPTDVATRSLTVSRATSETHYVEQRSACGAGAAVTTASITALVDLLVELSTPQSIVVEGTLRRGIPVNGPVHYWIRNGNDDFALALDPEEERAFVPNARARVVGTPLADDPTKLDVEDILVCPDSGRTINCMPPTHSNACKNVSWIGENCPGVDFVF